jgi:hypothetical protein
MKDTDTVPGGICAGGNYAQKWMKLLETIINMKPQQTRKEK